MFTGDKIGPNTQKFNRRASLERNDLLIRSFPSHWFEEANKYDDPKPVNSLGDMFQKGNGVTIDEKRANGLYAIAAQGYENYALEGKTTAMTSLGELYVDGHGIKKEFQKAMLWFKCAAKQGNAEAVQLLKNMTNNANKK